MTTHLTAIKILIYYEGNRKVIHPIIPIKYTRPKLEEPKSLDRILGKANSKKLYAIILISTKEVYALKLLASHNRK